MGRLAEPHCGLGTRGTRGGTPESRMPASGGRSSTSWPNGKFASLTDLGDYENTATADCLSGGADRLPPLGAEEGAACRSADFPHRALTSSFILPMQGDPAPPSDAPQDDRFREPRTCEVILIVGSGWRGRRRRLRNGSRVTDRSAGEVHHRAAHRGSDGRSPRSAIVELAPSRAGVRRTRSCA